MNRTLIYAAVASLAIATMAVTFVPREPAPPPLAGGMSPAVRAANPLSVGQVANFTLAPEAKPAQDIAFVGGDQRERTLADFKGQVVLLNFWATWCAPCVREMPSLARLQTALGGPGFKVVALSSDRQGLSIVREFYAAHRIDTLELYVDTTNNAGRKFGILGLPTTVVLDRDGREIGRMVGPAAWDSPEAIKLLRHIIARTQDADPAPAAKTAS